MKTQLPPSHVRSAVNASAVQLSQQPPRQAGEPVTSWLFGAGIHLLFMALLLGLAIFLPAIAAADDPHVMPVNDGGQSGVPVGGAAPPVVGLCDGSANGCNPPTTIPYNSGHGPVMRNVVNYVIIWNPPGSTFATGYRQVIEQYFTDVGGTPFMNVVAQYNDTTGAPVPITCYFGGTWVDTGNAYPHAGTYADPLTPSDIQNEVNNAIAANPTWQKPGLSTMYFVYLGQAIIECMGSGNCFAGPGVPTASAKYCAWHNHFDSDPKIYACMHYAASSTVCGGAFAAFPNGKAADLVISTTSHEQMEAYSDPELNAWAGCEVGDNCAYHYGQCEPDGTTLVLHGHRYQMQEEWSNAGNDCVKRLGPASQPTITGDLTFGTVPRGTTMSRSVVIQNTGGGDLNLLNVRLNLGAPGFFSIDPSSPLWGTVPPGDGVAIQVNVSPSASASSAGPFSTTLIIDTDEPGFETQSITVSATVGLPTISTPGGVTFPDTCVGSTSYTTLNVCNTGGADLHVSSITSANPQFKVIPPTSGYPITISPNFCFPFRVQFAPTSAGNQATTFTVSSDDPANATTTVSGAGNGVGPTISSVIANSGNFGDVCLGNYKDLNLTINNAGGCALYVSSITSTLPGQFLVPTVVNYPLVLQPGDSIALPIRFQPTGAFGPRTGNIIIASNDPSSPNRFVAVSGNVPSGTIAVTGSTAFGDVCAGTLAEKTISICNVGKCDLHVTGAALNPGCANFTLINNPFPATVSPDSCLQLVVQFTPTSCGADSCTLVITSDDPTKPTVTLTVTADMPCPTIDVPPDLGFAPEVIQSIGPCSEPLPFPISNKGNCNLTITAITIGGANAGDFGLSGLPSFPVILQPGDIVGAGDLNVTFAPTAVARARTATISVTYISDPISGATTTVTRNLCGEGVLTGARVLVMAGGVPLAVVDKIQLQRLTVNRSGDVVKQAPLATVFLSPPCGPFQYHREYGTVSNPVQLLAGDYQVTVSAIINGKHESLSASFSLNTCDFNPTVVINF